MLNAMTGSTDQGSVIPMATTGRSVEATGPSIGIIDHDIAPLEGIVPTDRTDPIGATVHSERPSAGVSAPDSATKQRPRNLDRRLL